MIIIVVAEVANHFDFKIQPKVLETAEGIGGRGSIRRHFRIPCYLPTPSQYGMLQNATRGLQLTYTCCELQLILECNHPKATQYS